MASHRATLYARANALVALHGDRAGVVAATSCHANLLGRIGDALGVGGDPVAFKVLDIYGFVEVDHAGLDDAGLVAAGRDVSILIVSLSHGF